LNLWHVTKTLTSLSIADVQAAAARIAPHLPRTPIVRPERLGRELDLDLHLKLETQLPTRAFKVRGGVNFMAARADELRGHGVTTASTGNHGQSIAYAAQLFNVPAIIFAPRNANGLKVAAMEAFGATVKLVGEDMAESAAAARAEARDRGMHFISSGDEPLLISGVATMAWEALNEPTAAGAAGKAPYDVIIVPVGGGSNAAGTALVAKTLYPQIEVIAVQSASAPAAHDAWHERTHVQYRMQSTRAEGLATRESYDLPQSILAQHLDEFALVTDDEMIKGLQMLARCTGEILELSAAAGLAYILRQRAQKNGHSRFQGKRILLPITGANVERYVTLAFNVTM
jgi:threonine dehydratase